MDKLNREEYASALKYIDKESCGAVYPLSIAGLTQTGDIFTTSRSVLFWHKCGFAFVYGEREEEFLDEIYDTFFRCGGAHDNTAYSDIAHGRRFVLFTSDKRTQRFFSGRDDVSSARRLFFEYPRDRRVSRRALPEGFQMREIDGRLLDAISGRITPSFSWDGKDEFLQNGKGFCVTDGEIPAAWAFSAAVGGDGTDIGVETAAEYRHKGLGAAAARKMTEYVLERHKRPMWACHEGNAASRALAESIGFVLSSECAVFTRASASGKR